MTFDEKYIAASQATNSKVCVGLDPDIGKLEAAGSQVRVDLIVLRQISQPLHKITKLAHVAWPWMLTHSRDGFGRELGQWSPSFLRKVAEEMFGEQHDVVDTIP